MGSDLIAQWSRDTGKRLSWLCQQAGTDSDQLWRFRRPPGDKNRVIPDAGLIKRLALLTGIDEGRLRVAYDW